MQFRNPFRPLDIGAFLLFIGMLVVARYLWVWGFDRAFAKSNYNDWKVTVTVMLSAYFVYEAVRFAGRYIAHRRLIMASDSEVGNPPKPLSPEQKKAEQDAQAAKEGWPKHLRN